MTFTYTKYEKNVPVDALNARAAVGDVDDPVLDALEGLRIGVVVGEHVILPPRPRALAERALGGAGPV